MTTTVTATSTTTNGDLPTVALDLLGYGQWTVLVTLTALVDHVAGDGDSPTYLSGTFTIYESVNGATPVLLTSSSFSTLEVGAQLTVEVPWTGSLPRSNVVFSSEFTSGIDSQYISLPNITLTVLAVVA